MNNRNCFWEIFGSCVDVRVDKFMRNVNGILSEFVVMKKIIE